MSRSLAEGMEAEFTVTARGIAPKFQYVDGGHGRAIGL